MSSMSEDQKQFEESFYNWALRHGVEPYTKARDITSSNLSDKPLLADVDLNELRNGIFALVRYNNDGNKHKVQAIKSIAATSGSSYSDAKAFYDSQHNFSNVETIQP